jgi:hypothetical protein
MEPFVPFLLVSASVLNYRKKVSTEAVDNQMHIPYPINSTGTM